ncbi:MAG: hypothetical protein H7070_13890 [Saprospiraceae bacterium]|nr:hypothetical protein [Pyrinomonadaceae bacterium]
MAAFVVAVCYFAFYKTRGISRQFYNKVTTIISRDPQLIEPFGVAVKEGQIYISDGESGTIMRFDAEGKLGVFAENLHTPSAIAFDKMGNLIVADSGSHTIKKIDASGAVSTVAGTEGRPGDVDGEALSAKFNAPIGIAVSADGTIAVADTYNDKIKLIRDGQVITLAGSTRGFADGAAAKFDTPCGVVFWNDGRILVADTENRRLRVIEGDGRVWTLAGSTEVGHDDGLLTEASFIRPTAIAIGNNAEIYIADNDSVRAVRGRNFPYVETISGTRRGFIDGVPHLAAFNRVSGLAVDGHQNLIAADSDNGAVRKFLTDEKNDPKAERKSAATPEKTDPAEFRVRQPPRWPYEPPATKRDIAGTLGEIRGEIVDENSQAWFHNGLDIAGGYGERTYFVRGEKVLHPAAVENFGTSRELIRMPSLGYIHIRLSRDKDDNLFAGSQFKFEFDADLKPVNMRIPRGVKFEAGDVIGTLNAMNHLHLIAGPGGDEMNALDALIFPGITDSIVPVIEKVTFFDENWLAIETNTTDKRTKLAGKTRIVVRAHDRMDGNSERRRLGVYRLGYQVLREDKTAAAETKWNISFDRNPDSDAVKFVYAKGSKSGATGETVFNYIVTNHIDGGQFSEDFLDVKLLVNGTYILRVFAADFFGNIATTDIFFEVTQ